MCLINGTSEVKETVFENRLGFAPNRWSELNDYLINKGHSLNDIIALGLVKESEKGQYDAFWRHRRQLSRFMRTSVLSISWLTMQVLDTPKL